MKEQIEEMAKAKMFFMTTDSEFIKYNGTEVEIIRPLTDKECDIEDVGNMYKARFYDGYERDVFEDELINKTIYDIATKICSNFNDGICCVDGSTCILNCEYNLLANQLYNAGYRKQSENTVELPCKVGDTVYCIEHKTIRECLVTMVKSLTTTTGTKFFVETECEIESPFYSDGRKIKHGLTAVWEIEWGCWYRAFRTREEAEKALAKMKGGEANA